MATTEIEKLERRYAENPQGLTFAPLAEVHRKNGDIPRALELLRTGLELHPNYIPASIVLGRCLWAEGDLPAAEAAFSHVLRLDDENVIALKSLADISERLGRVQEAQRWLKRLISIDRSNEEARQHLARLEALRGEAPVAADPPPPAPVAEPESIPKISSASIKEVSSAGTEPARIAPEEPAPLDLTSAIAEPGESRGIEVPKDRPIVPAPSLEFLDTSESTRPGSEPSGKAAQPQSPVSEDRAAADQTLAPVDGLISAEFVPPKETGYRLHPELTQEFGAAEKPPEMPEESSEPLEVEIAEEVELRSSGADEFRVPNAAEDFMEAVRAAVEATSGSSEPAPELSRPAPEPAKAAPEPVKAAKAAPEPILEAPAPARPSYSAQVTNGQSVASFFRAMLAARPPGSTRPAASSKEELKLTPETLRTPPGTPAAEAASEASVSFDDFFGAPAGGSSAPKGDSDTGKDDLDQFQSWLQNLKR
jgi:tetratricopeptide (TPR) repeat protein